MSFISLANKFDNNAYTEVLPATIVDVKNKYTIEDYLSKGVKTVEAGAYAAKSNDVVKNVNTIEEVGSIGYDALHKDFATKVSAYGVYSDGVYVGVVRDKQIIEDVMFNIRAQAFDRDVVDVKLSHNLTFSEVQMEEELIDDTSVLNTLNGFEDETIYYEVKPGDSIGQIAESYGKTLEDIYKCPWIWNGNLVKNEPENFRVGLLVLVPTNKAYLRPIITKKEVECKQISFKTETLYDDTIPEGEIRVITDGKYGMMEVTHRNTYDNDVLTKTEVIESTILAEPVTEVVVVGTMKLPNMATGDGGSGKYFFPITSDKARITAYMGDGRGHKGLDIAAPRGTEIYSAASGKVKSINYSGWGGGYGIHVLVENDDGNVCMYAHMSYVALDLKEGDVVKERQLLGYVGSTGDSSGNHLHFEVRSSNGSFYNPCNYVSQN